MRVEIVHVDAVAEPDVPAEPDAADLEPHLLVERVEVRLAVLVEVADVLPVAVEDAAVHRPAHLEQEREELLREVERTVRRDVLQHLRLEHVDAGVDRVGEDLPPRRLLEEALDAAVLVGDDDAELERVVDRLQPDRHRRLLLAVEVDEASEVDVAQRVAGDDEERVVEAACGETHRSGRSGRRLLDRVREVDAERLAGAEVAPDRLRQERDRDDDVLEAVPLEQLDDVLHARLPDDRDERLRLIRRERTQARALAARHDDGLHACRTFRASRRYNIGRDDGSAEADPEEPERPCGRVVRDDAAPDGEVQEPRRSLADDVHVELDAARREHAPAGEQQQVACGDDDETGPRQSAVDDEQDDRRVDHQAVRERVGDLPEARLHVPQAGEEPVDLIGDAGDAEEDPGRPAMRVARLHHEHDEDGDDRETRERQRVRKLRERSGDRGSRHPGRVYGGAT